MGESETAASERVNVSAFVDRGLREQLGELARAEDRWMSAIVRAALKEHLARGRREPDGVQS
jgi:predicted transcriptional regulator